MSSVIGRYLARLFLARFALLLLGLSILVATLDFLADGDQILAMGGGIAQSILRYTVLRLPEISSEVMPFTALLAALLTLTRLARYSELAALQSAGVSQAGLLVALTPPALLVAALQFFVQDQAVPISLHELKAWGVGDYAADPADATWLLQGDDVIRIDHWNQRNRSLNGVTIFHRGEQGHPVERVTAETGAYDDHGWTLHEVVRSRVATRKPVSLEHLTYPGLPDPSVLASLSVHPRELSLVEILRVKNRTGLGGHPRFLYEVWAQKRIAGPLAIVLLVLLAIPLVQRFQRRARGGLILAVGIGIGFLYWTFDGLVLALGEAGLLPPFVAVWTPALTFAAIAGAVGCHQEFYKVPRTQ